MNSNGAAISLAAQGTRLLSDYVLGFMKLKPPGDLFSQGMRCSIRAFHEALRDGVRPPIDIEHGAAVIEACEKIVCAGGFHE
jgi:hypothetical protein